MDNIERLNRFANMTFLYGNRVSLDMDNLKKVQQDLKRLLAEREKYTIRLTDEEYRKVIENAQMDTLNDRVIAHKFAVMQQQINEKDKRIQELEEVIETKQKIIIMASEVIENSIQKQVVVDVINENGFEVYTREYGNVEVVSIDVLQELLEGEVGRRLGE